MNGSDISQKIDLVLSGQKKLQTLVDRVEVSLLNEIVKNRKQIAKNSGGISDLQKQVARNSRQMSDLRQETVRSTGAIKELTLETRKTNEAVKIHEERIFSLEANFQPIAE